MEYHEKYLEFRESLWSEFELIVRKGAHFQELLDVTYPRGHNPPDLAVDTDGDSWFLAKELVASPKYQLHIGEDIIVGTGTVVFIDTDNIERELEPDILDLYWLSKLHDAVYL